MAEDEIRVYIVKSPALGMGLMSSGDSYSAVGYDVRGEHPSNSNPFGNAQMDLGTSSGGPNWVFSNLVRWILMRIGALFGSGLQ